MFYWFTWVLRATQGFRLHCCGFDRIILRLWVRISLCHRGVQSWENGRNDPISVFDPMKCQFRCEPDRRSTFFRPHVHLCAVTYIIEISMNVTLSNQFDNNQSITPYFSVKAPFEPLFHVQPSWDTEDLFFTTPSSNVVGLRCFENFTSLEQSFSHIAIL